MRKMTKHKVRAAGFREIIKRHHGNVRDALNTELLVSADIDKTHEDLLNYAWQKLYPGKTDWEYPGQVINHLWAEIEIQRKNAELSTEKLNKLLKCLRLDEKDIDEFIKNTVLVGEPFREDQENNA